MHYTEILAIIFIALVILITSIVVIYKKVNNIPINQCSCCKNKNKLIKQYNRKYKK